VKGEEDERTQAEGDKVAMSVSYSVSCRDCKVTRDLGVFYSMRKAANRAEAIDIAMEIRDRDSFRAALLASFMWEHKGHNCTVFNEHDDALSEELDPFENKHGVKEDPVSDAMWLGRGTM
jgi:hypothetical protein